MKGMKLQQNTHQLSYWLFPLAIFLSVFSTFHYGFLDSILQESVKTELVFSNTQVKSSRSLSFQKGYSQSISLSNYSSLFHSPKIALFNYNENIKVIFKRFNQSFISYKSNLPNKEYNDHLFQDNSSKNRPRSIIG
jgi:hypothetical protein